jgi:hypothetical protein
MLVLLVEVSPKTQMQMEWWMGMGMGMGVGMRVVDEGRSGRDFVGLESL